MKNEQKLRLGIPTRFLLPQTLDLLKAAGYNVEIEENTFRAKIDDPEIECYLGRAVEVAKRVADGIFDVGISSKDRVIEAGVQTQIQELCDLEYTRKGIWGSGKIAIIVPNASDIQDIKDLEGKIILTRFPEVTKQFLQEHKVTAILEVSDIPNEPQIGKLADAGVEFVLTGGTLEAYNLRSIATIMETSAVFIANKDALQDTWKKEKIDDLLLLLQGARRGQEMVGLMLHASNDMMEEVLKILPALKKPTVTLLRGENWFEVFTVAKEKEARKLIPQLKNIGCTNIIEFPLNKVVI